MTNTNCEYHDICGSEDNCKGCPGWDKISSMEMVTKVMSMKGQKITRLKQEYLRYMDKWKGYKKGSIVSEEYETDRKRMEAIAIELDRLDPRV